MGGAVGIGIGLAFGRSAWTPARLPGLKAWSECHRPVYQDPAMTVLAGPGDPVGGVPDLSGSGYPATQVTQSLKPTLTASAFPSGRAGLSFDGVDDRLLIGDLATLFSGNDVPFTVGIVFRLMDSGNRALQGMGNASTSTPYTMIYSTGAALVHYRRDDASAAVSLSGPALGVGPAYALVATFGEPPGVTARNLLNGSAQQTGSMDVGQTTLNRFVIGATERSGSPLYPFKGYIGAWVVCAGALGADDRARLAAYLMAWAGV